MGISMTDIKLDELARLISSWPRLMAKADRALIDDSLVLVDHLGAARSLVDVGSGAGLPGLPIKIARPDLRVTLIEADQAKAAFLVHASAALGLEGVEVVARRAEDAGQDPALREAFDVAVARALAPLPVLVELCLPLVRVGGRLLAQKTEAEEVASASNAAIASACRRNDRRHRQGAPDPCAIPAAVGDPRTQTLVGLSSLLPYP